MCPNPCRMGDEARDTSTSVACGISEVLFSTTHPHPHNVAYRQMNPPVERVPLGDTYVFSEAQEQPVVVFKESEGPLRKIRVPLQPEIIEAISEALKRPKKPKKVDLDSDDIFDFPTELPVPELGMVKTGPLFEDLKKPELIVPNTFFARQPVHEDEDDDTFGKKLDLSQFGIEEEERAKKRSKKNELEKVMKIVNNRK